MSSPELNLPSPIQVKSYPLSPTPLIPNSPRPLVHYPSLLLLPLLSSPDFTPALLHDLYASNGWQAQWIARYGPTQPSHYHSASHEAMVVVSGEGATIRFGIADAEFDGDGKGEGKGGVTIEAKKGDVFIIPAGVAHKTYDPRPGPVEFAFWEAPKDGDEEASRGFYGKVEIGDKFMMMGAYPRGYAWDFMVGGEDRGKEDKVWDVDVPGRDPVLGEREEGLCGLWKRRVEG